MQRRGAIKSTRPVVVLSSDRWTKVLVRRQAHAFEIVVGMAQGGIRATRFRQRRSSKRCHREARRSVRRASPGTGRSGQFRSAMARKGENAIGDAPKGKSRSAGIALARHRQSVLGTREALLFLTKRNAETSNANGRRLQSLLRNP